jgi:ABC-type glycerol-3-phosphate transport system permease component
MSEYLAIRLPAIAANLAGMLVIYCLLSHLIARYAWHRRGIFGIVALITLSQLCWLLPLMIIARAQLSDIGSPVALWYGNWVVCGFSLVLLWRSTSRIPIALADSARLDGLGVFAAWKHVVLPFVSRDLALIAAFTIMATLLPIFQFRFPPNPGSLMPDFEIGAGQDTVLAALATFVTASVLGALPLFGIFFAVKRQR